MCAPFLSCCELWYGTNRICYDFVLRETWHPEILLSKMLKSKLLQWLWIPTNAIWHDIQIQNLSHMLLVWSLSFVKLLWPLLRFSSCTHDQDTRIPTNKLLTLTLRVMQKHIFFVHQIITPFIYHVSFSQKFSYAKKNSMGYAKKRERKEKKYPCQKAWEKKNACRRAWRKEKKERKKDSPYFQIKGIHPKRERFMIQRSTKNI